MTIFAKYKSINKYVNYVNNTAIIVLGIEGILSDDCLLMGAHTTAYSANLCRRMRQFVHTLVCVAYVRRTFCISYGYATIRRHMLSYVVYANKFLTYADVLIIRYS